MNKIFLLGAILVSLVSGCATQTVTPQVTPTPVEKTQTAATQPVQALTPFIARGTEPFWAFEQTATGAKYSAPGESGVDEFSYTSVQTNSGSQIIVVATPIASGSVINLTLTPGTCSDGMSDGVYAYNVLWTFWAQTLVGCAN